MPERPKFYLDVHVSRAVEKALLRLGIDVVSGQDVVPSTTSDADHLALATASGRVLVSRDSDFTELAYLNEHAGIVKLSQVLSIGEIIQALHLIFEASSAEEMQGRIEYY